MLVGKNATAKFFLCVTRPSVLYAFEALVKVNQSVCVKRFRCVRYKSVYLLCDLFARIILFREPSPETKSMRAVWLFR